MADIVFSEKAKMDIRVMVALALKKLKIPLPKVKGKTKLDIIHDDLDNCTNPAIRKIWAKMKKAALDLKGLHQRSIIYDIGGFFLWILYKDTGYRDPGFWFLNELIDDEDFKKTLKPFVKQPKEWYCNRWMDTKGHTEEMKQDGKLTAFEMSEDERIYVPSYQAEEWKKIEQEFEKEQKRRK